MNVYNLNCYIKCTLCIIFLNFTFKINYLYADNSVNVDDIDDEFWNSNKEDYNEAEEITVNDPYEKFNRKIFVFNERINKELEKIVPTGAKPGFIRQGISNFAQNFFEIPRFINYSLQGNNENAGKTVLRYLINTCIGFFGVMDVAEKLGLEKKRTTFNDTLKKWGVPSGSFIVLPLLGPTCMRGAVSQLVHVPLDTLSTIPIKDFRALTKKSIYCLAWFFDALNTRSAYGEFLNNVVAMSKDRYKTVRNLIMAVENQ